MHAVTIAARNYLPFARLLARSFLAHNPQASFSILVVDARPGEVPAADGYQVLTPGDLPMPVDEFRRMAMIYDVTELSTALKPWALEALLDRDAEVAVYLDPDILVYDDLGEIDRLSRRHGIVLTPHAVSPMQRDGMRPTEADIMGSGIYNLGFVALDGRGRAMLRWWQERLLRDAISAPEQNLFTDQRWMDFVPSMFEHTVLRDRGYNVAYWNLDSRALSRDDDGGVLVDGTPLRFFHFSGYRPETPWLLSKYVADSPRVVLSEHPVAAGLCAAYGEAALAEGIEEGARVPYRYNALDNGVRITRAMRRTYRDALLAAEKGEEPVPPAPFAGHDDEVVGWLRAPVQPGHPMTRAVHGAWKVRPDIQASFPSPLGADEDKLLIWARTSAVAEGDLVPEVLPGTEAAVGPPPWEDSLEPGANVCGYFTAELGVGQSGRLVVDAVRASGLPHATVTWTRTLSRTQEPFVDVDPGQRYPVNVAVVNADQVEQWVADMGPLVDGRYLVAVWAWEVEEFPRGFSAALDLVDEVWAVSSFVRDAIARTTAKPVHVLPHPVLSRPEPGPLDRAALGLPDGPMFLFAFDYLSVFERKNPLATVAAFASAFAEGEGPILVVKSVNGDLRRSDRERLRAACSERHDVYLIEDYLPGSVVSELMADATAYVSLHRSEGYGLTLAESMALGVPVVATGYSGNLDFMSDTDSLLVPYELVPVAPGSGPYPSTTQWADPDVAVAAQHLRRLYDDPGFAADLGKRGRDAVLSTGDLGRAASFVRTRVEAASAAVAADPEAFSRRVSGSTAQVRLQRARDLMRSPLDVTTASRMRFGAASKLRKVVARVLNHHDQQVNLRLELLADAIEASTAQAGHRFGQLVDADHLIEAMVRDVSARVDETRSQLDRLDVEQTATPYMSHPEVLRHRRADGSEYLGLTSDTPGTYAGFEDVFRGSEQFVVDRLEPYLGLLKDAAPVLDIGCGRGELLDLLRAVDIEARGIDLDESMLARCRAKGLDVMAGDAVDVLASTPDGTWGAITSMQVVEHLEVDGIRRLFEASRRTLRPGGLMIAETVNPHAPAALKTFWLDITHVRPLFPESMLFLAREAGFSEARIYFPHTTGDMDSDLRRCGEYALVATRS